MDQTTGSPRTPCTDDPAAGGGEGQDAVAAKEQALRAARAPTLNVAASYPRKKPSAF